MGKDEKKNRKTKIERQKKRNKEKEIQCNARETELQ